MKTFSPLQWPNLGKSFTLFFILLTLAWSLLSFLAFGDIYVSWLLLAGNLFLSGTLAWFYYRYRYHTRFSYDEAGFEMVRGRLKTTAMWKEFGSVSLVHLGGGRFAVRLYRKDVGTGFACPLVPRVRGGPSVWRVPVRSGIGSSIDIPASDLGLNPSQFRFEVMRLLRMGSKLKTLSFADHSQQTEG